MFNHLFVRTSVKSVISAAPTLLLLLSLLLCFQSPYRVNAADETLLWSRVNIPKDGVIDDWMMAKDSDIECIEIDDNGFLYCHIVSSRTDKTLYKSTDKGNRWSQVGGVTDLITDIEAVPGSSGDVYYSTGSIVYKSSDGGSTFIALPGLSVEDNESISCLDSSKYQGSNILAAGTVNIEQGGYGGIYIYDESEPSPAWIKIYTGEHGIYSVAFSPEYTDDNRLTAIISNENGTSVITRTGDNDWNQDIGQTDIAGFILESSVIVFPTEYQAQSDNDFLYVGLNSGTDSGDLYRIDMRMLPADSEVTDLNVGEKYGLADVDISGLDIGGAGIYGALFAGAANCTDIYHSDDGGTNWERCAKPPTGQSNTLIAIDIGFPENSRVYAVCKGIESAFSCSSDSGISWDQISLIDTEISGTGIMDFDVSPRYINDETMFLLTFDFTHLAFSVWRTVNNGESWIRILSSTSEGIDEIKDIEISPQYGVNSKTLYISGISNGRYMLWKSIDNGQIFDGMDVPSMVNTCLVLTDNDLFLGCFDGTNALVYKSEDGGQSYSDGVIAGKNTLTSLIVSPGYPDAGMILAGNSNGQVYYSDDLCKTFKPLPKDTGTPPFTGQVRVAFDPGFKSNRIVYASSNGRNEGVSRFVINRSDMWERIGASLPEGGTVNDLAVSANGVLYAINSQPADLSALKGGMERSLNPSFNLFPTFETVVRGLEEEATLNGLWLLGNRLWSIDTTNTRLLTFLDTMTQPVVLRMPGDGVSGIDTRNILLDWEVIDGATEYAWQIDYDGEFVSVPDGFQGNTAGSSIRLPELDNDTTYHWRVRVRKPVLSRWSEKKSFTTALGKVTVVPTLLSPGAGADLISSEPLFQWSAIAGAEKYELVVSKDVSFNEPAIEKTGRYALPTTAWQSDVSLLEGDTYYWKVRAVSSGSYSDWSAVSVFVTESEIAGTLISGDISVPLLLSPGAGSEKISLKPLFQWDAITGAEGYELIVSGDTSFDNPVIIKAGDYALPVTAWKSNISLDPDSAYYWKVRAILNDSYSDWSPVSAFSTDKITQTKAAVDSAGQVAALAPQPSPVAAVQGIPDWVIYLGMGLLAAVVLLQTTTLLVFIITRLKTH